MFCTLFHDGDFRRELRELIQTKFHITFSRALYFGGYKMDLWVKCVNFTAICFLHYRVPDSVLLYDHMCVQEMVHEQQ